METVLLKIPQVMERLGCGRTTVYGLIASGELRAIKFGRCRRVPSDEVERFMAGPDQTRRPSAGAGNSPDLPSELAVHRRISQEWAVERIRPF